MRAPELEIFSDVVRCLSTTLLGGWPLPALADGDALHIARTKGVFCSRGQKTLEKPRRGGAFRVRSESGKGWRRLAAPPALRGDRITSVPPWRQLLPASSWRLRHQPSTGLP